MIIKKSKQHNWRVLIGRIMFQHSVTLIPTQELGNRGWISGWQSRAETNTAVDSKGNTSGTFWDWQRGKTVPVVQSLPNLHQVSGIKGSISALDFHVWLNHPGQCVRCWTKWILSKKRSKKKKKKEKKKQKKQLNWGSVQSREDFWWQKKILYLL